MARKVSPQNPASTSNRKEQLRRVSLEIKASPIHRYGVFADEIILPGEVIEECPVILFDDYPQTIHPYAFEWQEKRAVPLGEGSIYNHSEQPNANYQIDHVNQLMVFTAIKPIRRGEEILLHYGADWFNSRIGSSTIGNKNKKTSIKRIIGLSLFLLVAYFAMPLVVKDHAHSVPAVTSVLQK